MSHSFSSIYHGTKMFELNHCKDGICDVTLTNIAYPVRRRFRDCNEANQMLICEKLEDLFKTHPKIKMNKWVIRLLYNRDDINNICNQIMYGFRLSDLVGDATMDNKETRPEGEFTQIVIELDCSRI